MRRIALVGSNLHYIRKNRFSPRLRKYAWIFILLVALGGLWHPRLGLLVIPVMLALGILGFLNGKYWCGNLCPHGSLFDYVIMPVSRNKKIPGFLRSKAMVFFAFFWFMFMLGQRLIRVSATFGAASFLDSLGFIFVMNYLVVTVSGSALAFYVRPRAWCSFCPMGTFQVLMYKLGKLLRLNRVTDKKVTVSATEACRKCGKCSLVCPMQLEPYRGFGDNNRFDNEMCIRCATCAVNCPAGILSFDNERRQSGTGALRAASKNSGGIY